MHRRPARLVDAFSHGRMVRAATSATSAMTMKANNNKSRFNAQEHYPV
jgi:hypothetical protein